MLLICLLSLLLIGLVNFYFSILILRKVSAAEIRLSFFEIRWQVHKNMRKYCQLTRAETGRIGVALYGYWGTVILLLLFLLAVFALALG